MEMMTSQSPTSTVLLEMRLLYMRAMTKNKARAVRDVMTPTMSGPLVSW